MAGTATRFDSTKIRAGSVGQLWAGLAVPGANGRLTLDADGTPDATANPSAKHLGRGVVRGVVVLTEHDRGINRNVRVTD